MTIPSESASSAARSLGAVLVATVLLATPMASAQATSTPTARVDLVQSALDADKSSSELWYFGWTGIYAAATGAEIAVAFAAADAGLRADARVGAVKSGIGLVAVAVVPPPSLFYAPCSATELATPETRAACLARQESRLDDAAKLERLGRSIWPHLGGIAVNVGAGLFSWLHDNRLPTAILATVVGIAVAEVQIFTRPTLARDVRDRPPELRLAIVPRAGGGIVAATVGF